jgi:hypothetical protein
MLRDIETYVFLAFCDATVITLLRISVRNFVVVSVGTVSADKVLLVQSDPFYRTS